MKLNLLLTNTPDIQAFFLAIVLLLAGISKIPFFRSSEFVTRSVLVALIRHSIAARIIHSVIGWIEITVAIVLLLPPLVSWEIPVATVLTASFVLYLLLAITIVPDKPCGCFGGPEATVSWRSVLRAFYLLVMSMVGWDAEQFWGTAFVTNPWTIGVLMVEVALVVWLSPEFLPLFHRAPVKRPESKLNPDCATAGVPLSETLRQLRASAPFRELSSYLRSDLVEHWREGCWRFLSFQAQYRGHEATVVFAVRVDGTPSEELVRAALVEETNNTTLLTIPPN